MIHTDKNNTVYPIGKHYGTCMKHKKFQIAAKYINKKVIIGIGTKAYYSWVILGKEFPPNDIIGRSLMTPSLGKPFII